MLNNKIIYTSNISSNVISSQSNSSSVPDTLFELMKTNTLIVFNENSFIECDGDKKKKKNSMLQKMNKKVYKGDNLFKKV